jgi:predicted RNase H-like HicB family nuclease
MTTDNVIYEMAPDGSWSARAMDLPVYAAGSSREEAERDIREAMALYIDGLDREGASASGAGASASQ